MQSEMGLESTFVFGKHKGAQLEDIIEDDPAYIAYLIDNEIVGFDEEALELITRKGIA